jgi:hypothetical protein
MWLNFQHQYPKQTIKKTKMSQETALSFPGYHEDTPRIQSPG